MVRDLNSILFNKFECDIILDYICNYLIFPILIFTLNCFVNFFFPLQYLYLLNKEHEVRKNEKRSNEKKKFIKKKLRESWDEENNDI